MRAQQAVILETSVVLAFLVGLGVLLLVFG
jgi:hypothetical protein